MNEMRMHGVKLAWLTLLLLSAGAVAANSEWPRMVESADGTPISFEVHGNGELALIFVHGWSCDARYWREQVDHFSASYRVVTVDLAGHGHSGQHREAYTMKAFGQDVEAVAEALGSERVILVGHSMGGPVIAHAARRMPETVVGLIGVDTFQDIGSTPSSEEREQWLAPLRADFQRGTSQFVATMFVPDTDAQLRDWIIADMAAAPANVAISAMEEMLNDSSSGAALQIFEGVEVPVITINADLWPTDIETNRRHIESFDAVIMEGTDHFLHLARPEEFNLELERAIEKILNDG